MGKSNFDSILNKVDKWKHSSEGQKRMRQVVDMYARNGIDETLAGSRVLTRQAMFDYADRLIEAVRNTAQSCDLPESVAEHFDSLQRGKVAMLSDGSFVMEISFGDDLSRPSLQPDDYEGVRNIIAIFNNGYPADRSRVEAISHVSGWWHGRNVNALGFRTGLQFMQTAVDDFNSVYGSKFGIHAEVGEIYQT